MQSAHPLNIIKWIFCAFLYWIIFRCCQLFYLDRNFFLVLYFVSPFLVQVLCHCESKIFNLLLLLIFFSFFFSWWCQLFWRNVLVNLLVHPDFSYLLALLFILKIRLGVQSNILKDYTNASCDILHFFVRMRQVFLTDIPCSVHSNASKIIPKCN